MFKRALAHMRHEARVRFTVTSSHTRKPHPLLTPHHVLPPGPCTKPYTKHAVAGFYECMHCTGNILLHNQVSFV